LPAEPAWLNQVHGADVVNLDAVVASAPVTADGAVTRAAGCACAIMVADCLPVLFASRDGRRIGAAHAGWRGLAAGVLENTVAACAVARGDLPACLGAAILQANFEVGPDVRDAFVGGDAGAARYFLPNPRG